MTQNKRRKTAQVNLRIDPALKKLAHIAALSDNRTVTGLIEKLLIDHLSRTGHLSSAGSLEIN